jgi:hypothetical protein
MRRLLPSAAAVCILVFFINIGISEGIENLSIGVMGDQQVAGQAFVVRLRNNGDKRLTYCTTMCGKLVDAQTSAKIPAFSIQKRMPKGWNIEVWRCNSGDGVVAQIIHGGEIEEFKIKILDPGTYRLRLSYKEVRVEDVGLHCEAIDDPKAMKQAVSDEFDVIAKPK